MSAVAMWLGYAVMLIGAIAAVALLAWQGAEIVLRRLKLTSAVVMFMWHRAERERAIREANERKAHRAARAAEPTGDER